MKQTMRKSLALLLALLFVVAVAVPASASAVPRPPEDSFIREITICPMGPNNQAYPNEAVTYGYRNMNHINLHIPPHLLNNSSYTQYRITLEINTTGNSIQFAIDAEGVRTFIPWMAPDAEYQTVLMDVYIPKEAFSRRDVDARLLFYRTELVNGVESRSNPAVRTILFRSW